MRQTSSTTTLALLLMAVALLIGAGCSGDNPVDPAGATSDSAVETFKVGPPMTFVEAFDGHRNTGGWSFYTVHGPIYEKDGGNDGGYLHESNLRSFAPHPGTEVGVESIFNGDYRERKVTSLGIDLRSIDYDYDITTRYLTLVISNDNGTPDDFDDDWGAYYIGDVTLPSKYVASYASTTVNEPGWVSYDFEINSQTSELPEGWSFIRWYQVGAEMPSGSWTKLMQNVSYIEFHYGDPMLYYILQNFDLGLDNARISWEL